MNTGSALAQFTITLSQAVTEPVQVDWFTSDGTAKAGVDYAANKGTVVFAPGETSKTVDILVYGRAVGTEDRSFFVEMLPPTNAILGASIGECIIHVDTSGSTPVTEIIIPTGPQGIQGKSAYQSYLDTTTDNPPKTEAEWVESLKGDPEEIAQEVAPLIDVGATVLTAHGTETLGHPDSTTVKAIARRVAYASPAKIATVTMADGDNLITHAVLSGDDVDFYANGFIPRVLHAGVMSEPVWEISADGKLLVKAATAGDVLYCTQYDFISSRLRLTDMASREWSEDTFEPIGVRDELLDGGGAGHGAKMIKAADGKTVQQHLDDDEARILTLETTPLRASEVAKRLADGVAIVIDCEGDSTTWGATAGNTGVQNAFNAPAVLKTTLTNLYGVVCTVNNNGISGLTMRDLIAGTNGYSAQYATRILSSSADIVYCNHGINDSQLNLDINQYRKDVQAFVDITRKAGKVPVLVTPNINPAVPAANIITEAKSKRLLRYVKVMRDVAAALNVDLVDNYYYYEKTTRMVSPVVLVPDGAHPSTEGYKMSGRNMAIPLVSAHVLYKAGDKAGLNNTTYFDNIQASRQYQNSGVPFARFEGNLSGTRVADNTGINMAVILDNPTDDTVMAMYGLQWASGTISNLYENGSSLETSFGGQINQYNSVTATDWDACYIPERCKLYAGLHVPGILTSTSISGASGEGFALSGFGLVPRVENNAGMTNSVEQRNFNPICVNSEIEFMLAVFSAGQAITLKGCSNDSTVINIDVASIGGAMTVTTSTGGSFQLTPSVTAACYRSKIKFKSDKTVEVSVGAASVTIPAAPSPWPNLYVSTQGQQYTVKYLG